MLKFEAGSEHFRDAEGETLEIMVCGDLCPRGKGEELVKAGRSSEIAAEMAPVIAESDLSIIQFETPLIPDEEGVPIPKTGPNIKVVPQSIELLKAFGFDVTLLANNHIGDFGPEPVPDTIRQLEQAGFMTVGAGNDLADARKPLKLQRNGLKVTIVNVAEHEYGTATADKAGSNPLDVPETIIDIMKLKKECDVLLVTIHGGNEYLAIPSPRMKSTYRAFADAGADAVINIHTHCPQGIELWNGTPIVYSLANFYFPALDPKNVAIPLWFTGYSVKLRFDRKGACDLKVIGHTFKPDGSTLKLLKGDDCRRFCDYLSEISVILADETEAKRYYDGWCAMRGPDVLTYLTENLKAFPVDYNDEEQWRKLLGPRNLHTCEAHNELITNFLRMIEEKRVEEAARYIPKIERLQGDELIFG